MDPHRVPGFHTTRNPQRPKLLRVRSCSRQIAIFVIADVTCVSLQNRHGVAGSNCKTRTQRYGRRPSASQQSKSGVVQPNNAFTVPATSDALRNAITFRGSAAVAIPSRSAGASPARKAIICEFIFRRKERSHPLPSLPAGFGRVLRFVSSECGKQRRVLFFWSLPRSLRRPVAQEAMVGELSVAAA